MAILNRINPSSKTNNDTGFGITADNYGGRFVNRDGTYNLKKIGIPFRNRFSLFHTMLNMSLWKFITVIVLFFYRPIWFMRLFISHLAPMDSRE